MKKTDSLINHLFKRALSLNNKSLIKRAVSLNKKLQKLDYRHYSDSASSDINALYHPGMIEFKNAKPFLDFVKDLEKLLQLILKGKNESKN